MKHGNCSLAKIVTVEDQWTLEKLTENFKACCPLKRSTHLKKYEIQLPICLGKYDLLTLAHLRNLY